MFLNGFQIAFADLKDDMDLAEDYLKYLVAYALAHCQARMYTWCWVIKREPDHHPVLSTLLA